VKSLNRLSVALAVATCLCSVPVLAHQDSGDPNDDDNGSEHRGQTFMVQGVVTTGYNMRKGHVLYDLGGVVGAQGFNYVFAYQPGMANSAVITDTTPGDTLLATGIDPRFYAAVGIDPSVINPKVVNLPFRQLPVTIDGKTGAKAALVPITSENYKTAFTLATPNFPITVNDWFKAEGVARIECKSSKESRVELTLEHMVPNGVYAVWVIIGQSLAGNGVRDFFSPKQLGGHPNVFSADSTGHAFFARNLPFCLSTDPDIMTVEITYEVDGITYGAVPSISPAVSNGNSYLGTPTQISFNVGGLKPAS
jgi:hypothetical protein